VTETAELRDTTSTPGQTYRYRIQLERGDGTSRARVAADRDRRAAQRRELR
jgi:hypothetical protein